jgi:glycosyltransferase A (GT-A) superfamily protein (DUF2064 family)
LAASQALLDAINAHSAAKLQRQAARHACSVSKKAACTLQ